MWAFILVDVLCIAACVIATVTDLRAYRIPNWLTVGAIIAGLVLNPLAQLAVHGGAGAKVGALSAVAGCVLMLLVFGLFGALRFVGMGDVKLMAGVGALVGWPLAMGALIYVTLAGGVLAMAYALGRGQLTAVLGNIFRVGRRVLHRGAAEEVVLHRIPYALAILAGSTWAVATRYWAALRLL